MKILFKILLPVLVVLNFQNSFAQLKSIDDVSEKFVKNNKKFSSKQFGKNKNFSSSFS